MKNVSPGIAANLEKSLGYSKAILGAIKGDSASFNNTSSTAITIAPVNVLATAEADAKKDKNVEVALRSPQKSVPAVVRQRKSVSCDLSETTSSAIDIGESKKSQSLRQVDQAPDSPFRYGGTASIRSGRSTATRTASTISGSSKSSKEKDFVEVPFKVCADALYAAATGDIATIKELLKQHPPLLNYAYPHCYRLTCLHVAARAGHLPLIRFLGEQGANPNLCDDNWQTPLHLAAIANKSDAFRSLLSFKKVNADMVDVYGLSARSYLQNDVDAKADGSSKTLLMLGSSIGTMAGISGFSTLNGGGGGSVADSSISNQSIESSSNGTFQRIGSLRPLRRQVKRVRHLFNN